ncbi:GldG family protein [Dyella acidiphila]|uniref:GldG family protein n=1 Tax=Dyella acidiphila TaxID=2775866 RepID=A0ABR9G812_9GAMM|nr:GldG family protein [Dyella acidiphila]MBE1160192.1 GldG family protein [Dyella acidiphila]
MGTVMRRLNGWLFALLVLLGALAIGYLSARHAHVADWTYGSRRSMSPETRSALAKLDGPVQIVSYANPQGDLRQTVATFLQRYQQVKPDLQLRFVDPQQDPAAMRNLGITVDGELILHYRDREQRLDVLNERSLTNALERLVRGSDRMLAFVTGDGERRADGDANADLGSFVTQLEQSGMRAVPLNFSQTAAVPEHTDLVVLASPQAPLSAGATKALVDYVANGGNLLWLADPGNQDPSLQPLADALGIHVLPGELIDASSAALGLKDPRMIPLGDYPPSAITRGFTLATLFPEVAPLAEVRKTDWQLVPFLRSSAQATTQSLDGKPVAALKGPLDFGFALSRLSPSPAKSEQRAAVIGNGDFLSNSYLGNGGNRALGERIVDWLLGDDELINMPPRGAPDRVLTVAQGELNLLSISFIVVLPVLLLVIGGLIAWRRRRA